MDAKQLITRNTSEIITEDELDEILQKDNPRAYIGYAPTGMMHIGHFTTVRKIADFLQAGFDFTFLIADIHAELDIEKTTPDLVQARATYYEKAIKAMLDASGINPDQLDIVKGSDYQHDSDYQKGYMHILENTTVTRAQRSVNEVVRHQEDSMKASGLLYSAMQIMDCVALDIDIAYAGLDQRRIYMLGREVLPKINEGTISCVFAPLLSGLTGGKMSASDASSKISIHDTPDDIEDKINKAYCPQGEKEDNGVLEYTRYLIFPILDMKDESFIIERPEKYGGDLEYESYKPLEDDFLSGELHPADLKTAVADHLAAILEPVREAFVDEEQLLQEAYPDEYGN